MKQRTQVVNALRSHLGELGMIDAAGMEKVDTLMAVVRDFTDVRLPAAARFALTAIADQINALAGQIDQLDRAIVAEAKTDGDKGKNVSGASRKWETLNYDAFSFLARQRFSEAPGKMNEHSPG